MDDRYFMWEKMRNIVKALRGSDNTIMGKIQRLKQLPQGTIKQAAIYKTN